MSIKAEKVNGRWNCQFDDDKENVGGITALIKEAADHAGMSFSDYLTQIKLEEEKEDELNRQRMKAEMDLNKAVKKALKNVPQDEAEIFAALNGLDGTFRSEKEVADQYHKSISTLHHICDQVAAKIRHDPDVHLQAIILNQYLK